MKQRCMEVGNDLIMLQTDKVALISVHDRGGDVTGVSHYYLGVKIPNSDTSYQGNFTL